MWWENVLAILRENLIIDIAAILGVLFSIANLIVNCIQKKKLHEADKILKKELQEADHCQEEKIVKLTNQCNQLQKAMDSVQTQKVDEETHRCEVINNYLKAVGRIVFNPFEKGIESEFGESISEIFMYTPDEKKAKVREMNDKVKDLILNQNLVVEHYDTYEGIQKSAILLFYELSEYFSDLKRQIIIPTGSNFAKAAAENGLKNENRSSPKQTAEYLQDFKKFEDL